MNREEALRLLGEFEAGIKTNYTWGIDILRNRVLDAMTATTIEQNVGTVEAGAKVVGVKIDRLG